MKTICWIVIALCLPLLLCGTATAEHSGPYAGAFFGGTLVPSSKGSDNQGSFGLEFNQGWQGSAVLGWDFEPGNPVGEGRIELEYSHRRNAFDTAKFVEGSVKGSGNLTSDSLLLNLYGVYHGDRFWSPYIGAGAGAARVASSLKVTGQRLSDGSDIVFAYQAGAGIDFSLTNALSLDLGYRFFDTLSPKLSGVNGRKLTLDYSSHSVVLGLRWGF
jgi:opacity protein-like surface antigen